MNMRIRVIACLCILSLLLSVLLLSGAMSEVQHNPEYTEYNEGVATNSGVYFAETWNGKGRIYLLNNAGDVLQMTDTGQLEMTRVHRIEVANDKVYAICSLVRSYKGDVYHINRVAAYSPELTLMAVSDPFLIDIDERISSIDIYNDHVYITTIGRLGEKINIYEIPETDLQEVSGKSFGKDDQEEEKIQDINPSTLGSYGSIFYRESANGRFYSDAYYDGSEAVILTDADVPSGKFAADLRVKNAVDLIHFNVLQNIILYSNFLAWWLGGVIIWFILMVISYIAMRKRNRMVYVYVVTEVGFVIIILTAILFIRYQYLSEQKYQNTRFASLAIGEELKDIPDLNDIDYDAEDYFTSDRYYEILNQLRHFIEIDSDNGVFYDAFIMRLKNGLIVTDAKGYNRERASFVYGSYIYEIRQELLDHNDVSSRDLKLSGHDMFAVGSGGEDPASAYAMVAVCYNHDAQRGVWGDFRRVIMIFAITFIIGSFLIFFFYYLISLDLAQFANAIRDVALGRTLVSVPDAPAEDIKGMWNSLSELCKRMEEINYDKYRIFEAYYRFAPKNIETIMGKDSIFDVQNGDSTKVNGTLMLLSSPRRDFGEKKVKSLVNIMSYMSQFSENEDGILVSQDSSLSMLQFLFLEDEQQAASKATQFIHRNSFDKDADPVTGFLYTDSFIYGVAGIHSQSLSFLTSVRFKEMEEYARWFEEMEIPLVVTEEIVKREDAGQTRYIGFIILECDGARIDLYEVVDASPARARQLKLLQREKFEETLSLLYEKQYYLARNQFSEILKEFPEDTLSKWYLFECERYLNGEMDPELNGRLRMTE
ncbi:MAG: hypothetical protein K6G42_05040 [Lachnospiraceae bacterium]|nr:hypothetical protein [Lachnospiraceae bacterium]